MKLLPIALPSMCTVGFIFSFNQQTVCHIKIGSNLYKK